MEKENVWGRIRKTVLDGVTIAAEKTEEYTRLGKAKLDVLTVKRNVAAKRTELGAMVYSAVREGAGATVLDSSAARDLIAEMDALENDLGEKKKVYDDLRGRAESDVAAVKAKAKSGMKEIKSRTKSEVRRVRAKVAAKTAKKPHPKKNAGAAEPGK